MERSHLLEAQTHFAVILGCSDSRVPVEMAFDQDFGDLFVIRVAGNVVASSQIASVEFAAEQFGVRLVVVMGHTNCGAVTATIDALTAKVHSESLGNLRSIVDRIRPAVEGLIDLDLEQDQLIKQAVRSNARISANSLRHGSQILKHPCEQDNLLIIGAEYCLETGQVEFFDGIPAADGHAGNGSKSGTISSTLGLELLLKFDKNIRAVWSSLMRALSTRK
ncbi:MAG: carbonic anhydrase [Candidatus Azotimanducaceae bacterium]